MTRSKAILVLGDLAAFVAFGALGITSHEDALSLKVVARAVLLFPAAWFAISPWLGAFAPRAVAGRESLLRLALTWLPCGVLALCLRAAIFDRALFNAFFVIALVGYGLFLVAWRAVYSRWLATSTARATG